MSAAKAGGGKKQKQGVSLPPKPALYTEEDWELAHSVPKLLELLSVVEKGSAAKEHREKPLATKQAAALWLWQLLGANSDAKDEAYRSKAAEILCKVLVTPGFQAAVSAHLLGCLEVLASPATEQQAVAVCEGVLAAKPPVLPWMLKQLEQPSGAGMVAAVLGALHALLACAVTRPSVCKIMAGWNSQPLVTALTAQQTLPLLGGRNASAHAAAVIELLCSPPAAAAAPAAAGSSSSAGKDGGKSGKASRAASAKSTSGSSAAAGGEAALASALQQGIVAAGGLQALLKVSTSAGITAPGRCSAVSALHNILSLQGHYPVVKQELLAANGLGTLVQVMGCSTLPLQCRAAAAGCVCHFLAPARQVMRPGSSSSSSQGALHGKGPGSLLQHIAAMQSAPRTAPSTASAAGAAVSRPGTSASLSKSIIQGALQQRRQQRAEQFPLPAVRSSAGGGNSGSGASRPVSGGGGITSRSSTSSGGGVTSRSSAGGAGAAAGAASTARPSTAAGGSAVELVLPPAPGDAAAAAVAAQQAVLLAQWGPAARQGLAAGGEQAVAAGVVPGLLLLCCGLEGPPKGLTVAAEAAAAAAKSPLLPTASSSTSNAGVPSSDAQDVPPGSSSSTAAADGKAYGRRITLSSGGATGEAGHVGEALDSIAEPSHLAEGEEEDATSATADSSRTSSAKSGGPAAAADGKKKGGKKSKKPAKLEPAMIESQTLASAAVKLLALSGDVARTALLSAGALPVLVALLKGPVAPARWNSQQALLSLSLEATSHTTGDASSSSSSGSAAAAASPAVPTTQKVGAGSLLPVKLPDYISFDNMPASHWKPVAPMSMPPQPPIPAIPGRSGGTGTGRPTSQGRRTSVSNVGMSGGPSGPTIQSSRMSSTSSFIDGSGVAPNSAGGSGRSVKGPRTSIAAVARTSSAGMVAAAAAAAFMSGAGSQGGSPAVTVPQQQAQQQQQPVQQPQAQQQAEATAQVV